MARKTPEEIEREIERTRMEMTRTVNALEDKLSPGRVVDYASTFLKESERGQAIVDLAARSIARNPLPVALIAMGVAWMVISGTAANPDGYGRIRRRMRGPVDPQRLVGYDPAGLSAREAAQAFQDGGSRRRTGGMAGGNVDPRRLTGYEAGGTRAGEAAEAFEGQGGVRRGRATVYRNPSATL